VIVLAAALSASAASSNTADNITPGVLGFLVVAGIGIALFFLLRSMNNHLRRVRSVHEAGLAPGSKIDVPGGGPGAAAGSLTGRVADCGPADGGPAEGADGPAVGRSDLA
jgi:hypothetical protein